MTKWLYLIGAILLEVGGTLSLRLAVDSAIWFVGVGVGYVGAFACLTLLLRAGAPIGLTYGVWAASGVALTAVLAAILFGDPLTWLMSLGIVIVIAGVFLVEVGAGAANGAARRAASDPENAQ
ncbi:QacE family quaternary ammonium compound efflux SMR transporter [Microbacterium schleiferi]|uniref:QacE family quaternary ammonium compound efflux SMR transporter n=1 Tax=Microbacterium schleiferi TaxID=69362 RepID=A0A7S8MUR7_9MICO|nr:SMR family transporter [Microbacterium schleiferi]QPE03522.1 QacE family quaternary ammonium compound efflux SMR transporter [Microbacterium schleiferi]